MTILEQTKSFYLLFHYVFIIEYFHWCDGVSTRRPKMNRNKLIHFLFFIREIPCSSIGVTIFSHSTFSQHTIKFSIGIFPCTLRGYACKINKIYQLVKPGIQKIMETTRKINKGNSIPLLLFTLIISSLKIHI